MGKPILLNLNICIMIKAIITTIVVLSVYANINAQNIFFHNGPEVDYCKQSYHSVLTPDNCLIIDEDVFSKTYLVGIKFLKLNEVEGFIDSLYVDDVHSGPHNILTRDPNAEDGNIYITFSHDSIDGLNYYNALHFSDAMEITGRRNVVLPITGVISNWRSFIGNDGDIFFNWQNAL